MNHPIIQATILIVLLTASSIVATAQDYNRRELRNIGDELFEAKKFNKALDYYGKLESKYGLKKSEYRYKIAICYLNTNIDKAKAIEYLKNTKKKKLKKEEDYYYALGKAYHFDYQFDKAIENYSTFLEEASSGDERKKEVERAIEMCNNGKELYKDPVDVNIENLGSSINTKYPEYVPVISSDEKNLIFTSRRKGCVGGLQLEPGQPDELYGIYYEDIYSSRKVKGKWQLPKGISNINTKSHDAAIALSPDGNKLFIYRSDSVQYGNIWICEKQDSGWSSPQKLPHPINTEYWEGSASITPDGQTLYFASNRPGGYGGRDIYKIEKLDPKTWGEPENLGPTINTEYDDDAPFIHPDYKTLYYSSKGHNSMGDYDIFKTKIVNDKWQKPLNLGYPINTTDDDRYFVLSGDGQHAYYASARDDSYGNLDLYLMELPNRAKPERVIVVNGKVTTPDSIVPFTAELNLETLENNEAFQKEPQVIFDINSGEFTLFLQPNEKYTLHATASEYLPAFDTFTTIPPEKKIPYRWLILRQPEDSVTKKVTSRDEEEKTPPPPPPQKTSGKVFMVSYYHFDKATLTAEDKSKLDQLAGILKEHTDINIEIAGHTDAIGSDTYNEELGARRAESVQQYLVQKGIDKGRISSNWYGEQKPFAPNTLPYGVDNPLGRKLNRRTEIILKGSSSTLAKIAKNDLERPEVYEIKDLLNSASASGNVVYQVQIAAYHDNLPKSYYKIFENIDETSTSKNNLKKFMVGHFSTYEEASKCKKLLKQMGIKGAFVVSYLNNQRIPVQQALSENN